MDDFGLEDESELPQFGFKHPYSDSNIEFTPVFSSKAQPNIEQFYFKKSNNENPQKWAIIIFKLRRSIQLSDIIICIMCIMC